MVDPASSIDPSAALLPPDEAERLLAVSRCGLLDSPAEPDFDDLTRLAAQICGTPIAVISLVAETRQWFKSRFGVEATETPRQVAFCAHAILDPAQLLIVPDATQDPRFAANELVTGEMGIRFYAGAPLVVEDGHALGTLCVIDRQPRELTGGQREALAILSRQVVSQIQLRTQNEALRAARIEHEAFFTRPLDMLCIAGADGFFKRLNPAFTQTLGFTAAELLARPLFDFVHPDDVAATHAQMARVVSGLAVVDFEHRFRCKDGSYRWLSWKCAPAADGVLHASARDITDQKQLADTLQRRTDELRLLFDYLPAFIVFKDTKNGLLRVNQRLADSLGKSVAEIEGRSTKEIYPQDAAKYFADDQEVIRSGVPKLGIVETFRDAENRNIWIQTDKLPVRDRDGVITGVVAMAQDITERMVAEHSLRDLAYRLQLATEVTGTGVWECPEGTGELIWDEQMFAIYGLETTAATADLWASLVHPDDLAEQLRVLEETRTSGGRSERRFRIRRRNDGAERIIYAAEMTVREQAGHPGRLIGVNRDITDLANAAATLDARDALFRQFIRHTPAAVAMLDREMRYLQVSDRWLHDYHLEGRQIIGLSHYEVFPDIPERWKAIHRRCLAGAVERCDEDPFPRADGQVEWLQWEIRPWSRPGGDIGGVIFFTQVITDRKRAEAQLVASIAEKETLLQEVHHRVKNNLQVISSLLSLQSRYIHDPALLLQFRECQGRIRSMALIHEKLYQSETLAAVDLRDYLASLARMVFASSNTAAGVSLDLALQPVSTDIDTAVPLGLLVNELLANALKHAFPQGRGGRIRLELHPGVEGAFTLAVEDDGIGLAGGNADAARETLGTRLIGLFVQQLGAVRTTESRPGCTRFVFHCPAH